MVRLVVFGDVDSMEKAVQEYNDSVLNDRNMKLRKVSPTHPYPRPHMHTHTHMYTHTYTHTHTHVHTHTHTHTHTYTGSSDWR